MASCDMGATLTQLAYVKLMLHAAKHPSCDIVGVLLGCSDDSYSLHDASDDGESKRTIVVNAVPFSHTALLAPMLESALALVQAETKKHTPELNIIGVYTAAAVDGKGPTKAPQRLCESVDVMLTNGGEGKTVEEGAGALFLEVSTKRLKDSDDHALRAFRRDSGGAKTFQRSVVVEVGKDVVSAFNDAIIKGLDDLIVDTDDHFDCVEKSPFNEELSLMIKNL